MPLIEVRLFVAIISRRGRLLDGKIAECFLEWHRLGRYKPIDMPSLRANAIGTYYTFTESSEIIWPSIA
jgi:hypothetical protein